MSFEGQKIINVDIDKEMKKSYLEYSMSVIVGRALPDVRDGLKPVHRRILYTLFENGLTPEKAYRKAADTVGSVLGRYHPHGDMSVYDALVRMAQDFSLRYPLIDGHGNFGSVDGDPPAAYRYTEARMSKISTRLLTDIDKDTVDFIANYDDRLKEPSVLPSRFPNLLVNGSTGIAVGMATNIPPHNLGEVTDAINLLIDDPEVGLEELMGCVKGPDFPTGGIIMGKVGIRAAYATGRGKVLLRGRAEIEENEKNGRFKIIITEIPYMVNKSRLIEAIADYVKDKRIEGISDLRDESDREGMRIVVELKRDANPQIVLNQLYSYTQLQDTFGIIMLAVVNGEPKVMHLKEILEHYIKFQCEIITRRTKYDLMKAKERAHILEGLKIALDFIDEVIAILRASKSIPEGKQALMERFGLDDIQSQAIVAMRLGQLTGLERVKIEEELAELMKKIAEFLEILASEDRIKAIVKEELNEIRNKFADERKTELAVVSGEVDIEDLIPVEECVLTMTHFGYMKRLPVDTYKAQHRGGRGISGMTTREEDFPEELFICSTHDYVMFFSNRGRVYKLKCYEMPEGSRTSKGTNVINMLPLEPEEKITSMIRVPQFEEDMYLVMITRKGIIKRTSLNAFDTARKGGLIALSLDDDDELAFVRQTDGKQQLIVGTSLGMAIRFDENDVRSMGRTARGVKAISLKKDDYVVGMARVKEDATLFTIGENGLGRRSELSTYRVQTRGGKGITNYKCSKSSPVAAIRVVNDNDDLIVMTSDGIVIRVPVCQVSIMSRYAKGVKTIRIGEDSKVVSIARVPHEDIDENICPEIESAEAVEQTGGVTSTENSVVATETTTTEE